MACISFVNVLVAAPGNVSDHVTIERQSESTITFCEGAKDAYLGYVTLKVCLRLFDFIVSSYFSFLDENNYRRRADIVIFVD